MKLKNRVEAMDLIHISLTEKLRTFVSDTHYLYTNMQDAQHIVKQHFPSWQYNGAAPFSDVMLWCEEHFGNNWIWNWETIYFKREKDLVFFKLKWT